MAKNYPNKSFTRALEIAETVNNLGGKSSLLTLADKLGKKISGSFHDDVNAAVKFDLIIKEKDQLRLSDRYTEIELAYTEEEKNQFLKEAFLLPDLYKDILTRFKGKPLPIDVLDKMLIREYGVSKSISKTVGNNLIKGGEKVGLIVEGVVIDQDLDQPKEVIETKIKSTPTEEPKKEKPSTRKVESPQQKEVNISMPSVKSLTGNSNISLNINIQLTVPETTNEEVYEKFFAAMKKHLLS